MPDDLHKKLTRRELRDLVEFLASLKEPREERGAVMAVADSRYAVLEREMLRARYGGRTPL